MWERACALERRPASMQGIPSWVGALQQRFDNWARSQRHPMPAASPPFPHFLPWPWNWKWPWQGSREQKQRLQEEYKRRREQIQCLCTALKAEDVADLQDVLSAVILSECVYKIPESELMRCLNKFKTDFGEQLVPLERVQPSLDHVQHRYLLAEAGDTLFASFVGTKQYRDVVADANILQGTLFHEDCDSHDLQSEDDVVAISDNQVDPNYIDGKQGLKLESSGKVKQRRFFPKPAAHKGFLARANGIPAVELYKLARKRNRKLVLCGHSLGGAVAVLAALAILRAFASSSVSKCREHVQVKCITFSQPPVGNAALRDYVHHKGWRGHFRTYCIPEDIVPRILSPAYFQHYRMHASELGSHLPTIESTLTSTPHVELAGRNSGMNSNKRERLVLGLGPLQNSLWRISKLVPLAGIQKPFNHFRKNRTGSEESSSYINSNSVKNEEGPQSLEIQEGSETVALTPLSLNTDIGSLHSEQGKGEGLTGRRSGGAVNWRNRVPSLPSYVPFGKLFFLGKSSVEPLSALEYTQLTSVQSVIMELRGRFQSHTMRSYRARFQRVYEICMHDGNPLFAMDHLPHLSHLQQWLGLRGAVTAQIGRIAEPLIIHTATSLVPLGWSGFLREKRGCEPLLIDVQGYGLHLCTLVKAQVNGRWCSTTVESLPPSPPPVEKDIHSEIPKLQKMRIRVGAPVQHSSSQQMNTRLAASTSALAESLPVTDRLPSDFAIPGEDRCDILGADSCPVESLGEVTIHCSSDFVTVSKEVVLRLRRVRLLGLEGAGKTSLFYALLGQGQGTTSSNSDGIFPNTEWQEGVAEGVAYIDPTGVNLQDLVNEVNKLKGELSYSGGHPKRKVDLVILVHNLSHKVPRLHQTASTVEVKPALSLLMDEVTEAGIPFILAITNKFSVSADRRQAAAHAVIDTYRVPSSFSTMVNSCPFVLHGIDDSNNATQTASLGGAEVNVRSLNSRVQGAVQKLISSPISFVQLPFRKKETVLPIEGIKNLRSLVHKILLSSEEAALEDLAREQLVFENQGESANVTNQALQYDRAISGSVAVGAIGAGFGLIVAVVAAAASSLRNP